VKRVINIIGKVLTIKCPENLVDLGGKLLWSAWCPHVPCN